MNGLPLALATPSLFTYYNQPPVLKNALVVGISQSGKSPDIVSVLNEGKRQGCATLAITNESESHLAKGADFVLVMFWDHASWHISKDVLDWVHEHNRQVKQSDKGVRLLICFLPKKSPWLNSIEPMWIHAKRKVVEPDRKLSAREVVSRVCSVFANPVLPFLMKS